MLNEHSKLGVAQTVFYAPVVPLVLYLNLRHGFGRERGWIFILIFSSFRLAGGVLEIIFQCHPESIGVTISTTILLGVGVPPLLIATMRFLGTACNDGFQDVPYLHKGVNLSRFLFLLALALLIGGGTTEGLGPGTVSIGRALVKAAYVILAVFLAVIVGFHFYLWLQMDRFGKTGTTVIRGTSAAIPFLIVRLAYAILSAFHPTEKEWRPLDGSVAVFLGMALIPEYVVVAMYLYVGIKTPSWGNLQHGKIGAIDTGVPATGGRDDLEQANRRQK